LAAGERPQVAQQGYGEVDHGEDGPALGSRDWLASSGREPQVASLKVRAQGAEGQ
jgi:hypothetical protein